MTRTGLSALVLILSVVTILGGQDQPVRAPAFDVASVKPNKTGGGFAIVTLQPSGRVTAGNMAARELILTAYGIDDAQLIGVPDWGRVERFEIEARTDGNAPSDQIRLMLRTLLADRFGLVVHNERAHCRCWR